MLRGCYCGFNSSARHRRADLERLTDGFFAVFRDASVGYVIMMPRTLARA